MSAANIRKIALVVVLLMALFIYLKFHDYNAKHFKVNAKSFHLKTTKETLLESEFHGIPLLNSANIDHIMMNEDVDIPLVDQRRTLHIEKAWLKDNFLYVLYSVDLKNTDQTLADVPKLSFSKIQLHFNNGHTVNLNLNQNNPGIKPPSRFTYNYRVYDEVFVGFRLNPQMLSTTSKLFLDQLDKIDKVTLLNPSIELRHHNTSLNPITFPAKLNRDKYYVGTTPINKEITVRGTTIQFKNVKNYYDHKELEYTVSPNKNHLSMLEIRLSSNGGILKGDPSFPNSYMTDLDLNSNTTYIENTGTIKISPEKVIYKLDQPIKITITPKIYKQVLEMDQEKKVADVLNGQVYFGFDNWTNPNSFYLDFKQNPSKNPQLVDQSLIPKNQASSWPMSVINQSTLISFTDLNGRPINWDASNQSSSIAGDGEVKDFFNMDTMKQPDKGFIIQLDGLMYEEPVSGQSITIS